MQKHSKTCKITKKENKNTGKNVQNQKLAQLSIISTDSICCFFISAFTSLHGTDSQDHLPVRPRNRVMSSHLVPNSEYISR